MKTETKTVHLNASREDVFSFLSNIENLPKWATSFCTDVKKEDGDFKAVTTDGEIYFTIHGDAATGVMDMSGGPTKDQMGVWPARVIGLMDGTSLFLFTCVQFPGVTDEAFAQECAALDEELEGVRKRFA